MLGSWYPRSPNARDLGHPFCVVSEDREKQKQVPSAPLKSAALGKTIQWVVVRREPARCERRTGLGFGALAQGKRAGCAGGDARTTAGEDAGDTKVPRGATSECPSRPLRFCRHECR